MVDCFVKDTVETFTQEYVFRTVCQNMYWFITVLVKMFSRFVAWKQRVYVSLLLKIPFILHLSCSNLKFLFRTFLMIDVQDFALFTET